MAAPAPQEPLVRANIDADNELTGPAAQAVPANQADPSFQRAMNGTDKPAETQPPTTDEPAPSTSAQDSKKRKLSTEDDRDWRTRREEDQTRPRGDRDQRRGGGGFRGRGGKPKEYRDYRDNIKSDFSSQPESSDPDEIRKQVEFYFSDSNLFTDKFLLSKVGGSDNNPVPIKVIHSFKRMRHFQPYSAVLAALRESEVLDVTADEEVQRKTPLPPNITGDPHDNVDLYEEKSRSRSIYAKGFGEEGPTTQFDIEAFFAPYGPTNSIRLRRSVPDKLFKGSVFVEFDSDETALQFLALEKKPKWDGRDLEIMSKDQYVKEKAAVDAERTKRYGDTKSSSGRGRGGGRGGRGNFSRDGERGRGGRPNRGRRDDRDRGGRDRGGRDRGARSDRSAERTSPADEVKADAPSTHEAPAPAPAEASASAPTQEPTAPAAAAVDAEAASATKKRTRTPDAEADAQGSAKKSKTDEADAAS